MDKEKFSGVALRMACETDNLFAKVSWMYSRTQSLFQRPCLFRMRSQIPIAAAADAPPWRQEWDEYRVWSSLTLLHHTFSLLFGWSSASFVVCLKFVELISRNWLLGLALRPRCRMYTSYAVTMHVRRSLASSLMRMMSPWPPWSVLAAFVRLLSGSFGSLTSVPTHTTRGLCSFYGVHPHICELQTHGFLLAEQAEEHQQE